MFRLLPPLLQLLLALLVPSAWAADPLPPNAANSPHPPGHQYAADAFVPTRLPHLGDIDRLIAEFDLLDGEPIGVRRENFGPDAIPEWLVVAPARRCVEGVCEYALFDGATAREIGRFYGTLLVLDHQHNAHAVIQTINRQDEQFSSLRTYKYNEKTYQLDDEVIINAAGRRAIESSFPVRR